MDNTFKITLGDGTMLENLRLNGNNYISRAAISEDIFTEEALREVEITDGETTEVLEDVILIQLVKYGNEYWFILAEKSPEQKEKEELYAELEAQAEAIMELAELIGGAE